MFTREDAQAKFNEYRDIPRSRDEVHTGGTKINVSVGTAAVTNHHFQNGETDYHYLPKRFQTTAPYLLLRQQPSLWYCAIIATWLLYHMMY